MLTESYVTTDRQQMSKNHALNVVSPKCRRPRPNKFKTTMPCILLEQCLTQLLHLFPHHIFSLKHLEVFPTSAWSDPEYSMLHFVYRSNIVHILCKIKHSSGVKKKKAASASLVSSLITHNVTGKIRKKKVFRIASNRRDFFILIMTQTNNLPLNIHAATKYAIIAWKTGMK